MLLMNFLSTEHEYNQITTIFYFCAWSGICTCNRLVSAAIHNEKPFKYRFTFLLKLIFHSSSFLILFILSCIHQELPFVWPILYYLFWDICILWSSDFICSLVMWFCLDTNLIMEIVMLVPGTISFRPL